MPSSLAPTDPRKMSLRSLSTFGRVCSYVVWGSLAALAVGLFILSLPAGYNALQQSCASDVCLLPWQLTPSDHAVLTRAGISLNAYATYEVILALLLGMGYLVVGLLLAWRKRHSPWGMIVALALITWGTAGVFADQLAALHPEWSGAIGLISFVSVACIWIFLYGFPDGRFVPHWIRWLVLTWILLEFGYSFFPSSLLSQRTWPDWLAALTWIGAWVVGIAVQVYRFTRQTAPAQRLQTKWVVCGFAVAFLGVMAAGANGPLLRQSASAPVVIILSFFGGPCIGVVALLIPPLCLAIAILRYRLWDIDILINRTLVYGLLMASVIGLYVLIVGGVGTLLELQGNLVLAFLATGFIAVLFQPFHMWLQRAVNRLMYGERDDPYRVLSRLGQRLEATLTSDAILPTIVETVTQALKLPYAAILLKHGDAFLTAATYGTPPGTVIRLPLIYQAEQVGEFILAPRAVGETFSGADRRLLEDLARQGGVAAHAVRLTTELQQLAADLQRSRERLVTAHEEERRRLRRDLHDGLGPQLASLTLKLETARNRLEHDPLADTLLADLTTRTQDAVADIRRLVYALRPPALDELGLVGALREQVIQFDDQRSSGLHITYDAPEFLPTLPAAVEVAAYRIAQEALTNVVRHAQAQHCTLRVTLDASTAALRIDMTDDGRGWGAEHQPGIGLTSMRERAEELGGTLTIDQRSPEGVQVHAALPCVLTPPSVVEDVPLSLQEV